MGALRPRALEASAPGSSGASTLDAEDLRHGCSASRPLATGSTRPKRRASFEPELATVVEHEHHVIVLPPGCRRERGAAGPVMPRWMRTAAPSRDRAGDTWPAGDARDPPA